jgi:glycosyltransferase involved in cell wall biosynthesis
MTLRILNVAFPFAPVSPDSVGGAEQILSRLDAALTAGGHESYVVACEGSKTAGCLLSTMYPAGMIEDKNRSGCFAAYQAAIRCALNRWQIDLLHFHGLDFYEYLPDSDIPALVTLHLPIEWYPSTIFHLQRPDTFMHCVSYSQHRNCPPCSALLPPIINGVPLELCSIRSDKRYFAIALSRIAPEKNLHVALDAARLAKIPMLLAGRIFPYSVHRSYYEKEIVPRLDCTRRFIGPIGGKRKWSLLSSARCLLVPSLAAETSSLVALEALGCGTPVIAFPSGALPEIIENGKTGFIVRNTEEMADAIQRVDEIDPQTCRIAIMDRFSLGKMISGYFSVYTSLAALNKKTQGAWEKERTQSNIFTTETRRT